MKKRCTEKSDELTELIRRALQDSDSVSKTERKRMRKLCSDPCLLVDAMKNLGPDFNIPTFTDNEDNRTNEEIIAADYIALAKFTMEKMQITNVHKLKATVSDAGFIIYALTPDPVELDYEQFATSDYPDNKELLLEAEALQSDLFMEDGPEKFMSEVIKIIEETEL